MPNTSISDVYGRTTEEGTQLIIQGTASGCKGVAVALECGDESIQRIVPLQDDSWSIILSESEHNCACEEEIDVTVSCILGGPNTHAVATPHDSYRDELVCREGSFPVDSSLPCKELVVGVDFDPCRPISEDDAPPARIEYGGRVLDASFVLPASDELLLMALGCNSLKSAALRLAAEFTIAQEWFFFNMTRGEVAAVTPMGPGERLSIRVQRSQRTQLRSSTVESKEEVRYYESSIADKEVMEAMRAVTKNEQWSVNASARVGIEGANASVSTGYQESVQQSTNAKQQRVRDAAEKASNQLKMLNKIEVERTSTTETIDERVRELVNPYRDRSLALVVYELHKHYCIEQKLDRIEPALVLSMPAFDFDRNFVLNNVPFLTRHLLDDRLLSELQDSLASAQRPMDLVNREEQLNSMARLAFRHLFQDEIFTFPQFDYTHDGGPRIARPTDDPANSFVGPASAPGGGRERAGWFDAIDKNHLNDIFMLLASFSHMRSDLENELSLSEVVVGLADQLKMSWDQVDRGHIINIYDYEHETAVFRRIPGFLAIVDKFMRPLLKGEDGDVAFSEAQRAGLVIERVVLHLQCYSRFYTERFHEYLEDVSGGTVHQEFFLGFLVDQLSPAEREQFLREFDIDRAFLDRDSLIVPYRGDDAATMLEGLFPDDVPELNRSPERFTVSLPSDGALIEAVPSDCLLEDISPPLPSDIFENVHLSVSSADDDT